MKSSATEIERSSVTQAADYIRMTHAIESHGFILKVLNEGGFELRILITLKQNIERLDDDAAKSLVRRSRIARQINLSVTAASQTVFDVITTVESALKKL